MGVWSMAFEFEDNSRQVINQMHDVSETAMEAACLVVEASAKSLTPVGISGELRDKLDHLVKQQGSNVIGQVGSPLDYAIYVEFGTGEFAENGAGRKGGWSYQTPDGKWHFTYGQPPKKFLRTSFRNNKENIKQIIGSEFRTNFTGG